MTRPLKIKYSGATAVGLQEMTDAEMDYASHQICAKIAGQLNGTHPLTLNVNGASGTSIGTFVDTYRPDTIGSHPVGTSVTTVTTTFKQILNADTTAPTRPLEWSSSAVREQSDASLVTLFNRVIARLALPGLGSYVLQPSAPATGTWTSIATITDTAQSGNTTTKLWRCTSYTAPTTLRPVKVYGTGMREMSDVDLQSLFGKYSSYVINSGPGQYRVQDATPTGGTWLRMGSAFSDTRQTVANQGYTGNYTANYASTFSTNYAGTYSTVYSGAYTGFYASSYEGTYSGFTRGYYAGSRPRTYIGYYTGNFTGYYAGSRTYYFAGSRNNTYTGLTVTSTKETPSNISLWLRTA